MECVLHESRINNYILDVMQMVYPRDSTIEEEYVGYVEEAKDIVRLRKILKYL